MNVFFKFYYLSINISIYISDSIYISVSLVAIYLSIYIFQSSFLSLYLAGRGSALLAVTGPGPKTKADGLTLDLVEMGKVVDTWGKGGGYYFLPFFSSKLCVFVCFTESIKIESLFYIVFFYKREFS